MLTQTAIVPMYRKFTQKSRSSNKNKNKCLAEVSFTVFTFKTNFTQTLVEVSKIILKKKNSSFSVIIHLTSRTLLWPELKQEIKALKSCSYEIAQINQRRKFFIAKKASLRVGEKASMLWCLGSFVTRWGRTRSCFVNLSLLSDTRVTFPLVICGVWSAGTYAFMTLNMLEYAHNDVSRLHTFMQTLCSNS